MWSLRSWRGPIPSRRAGAFDGCPYPGDVGIGGTWYHSIRFRIARVSATAIGAGEAAAQTRGAGRGSVDDEEVSQAADRLYVAGLGRLGLDLAAQAGDAQVDGAIERLPAAMVGHV